LLADALEDSDKRKSTIRAARELAAISPRPSPKDVYRQLLAASARGRRIRSASHDKVVRGRDGLPLFRIKHQRDSVAIVLPIGKVSAKVLERLQTTVANILQGPEQTTVVSRDCRVQPTNRLISGTVPQEF
jgi:hypothetical protein